MPTFSLSDSIVPDAFTVKARNGFAFGLLAGGRGFSEDCLGIVQQSLYYSYNGWFGFFCYTEPPTARMKHTAKESMPDFDKELDACGLNCPLPILRARKALSGLDSGQILHIIATDPGAIKDFEAFSKQTGNELLESREEGGKFYFLLKKKA